MPGMFNVFALAPVVGSSGGGGFDAGAAVGSALDALTSVFNFFVANPLALVFIGFSVTGSAFVLFRKFKRSAGAGG